MNGWEAFVTIVGLAAITVLTRTFFLLSDRELVLPDWVQRGLRYAPLAAIAAVLVPEIVMTQGHLIDTWRDPRVFGALAGLAFYAWRRSLFGTIVCGTGVMLALRFGLGW